MQFVVLLSWLLLASVIVVASGNNHSCQNGWHHYKPEDSCIKMFSEEITYWNPARTYCRQFGGDLLRIDNEKKKKFVDYKYISDRMFWIGLRAKKIDGKLKYFWLDDIVPADFFAWAKAEPRINANDYFRGMTGPSKSWHLVYMHTMLEVVCEIHMGKAEIGKVEAEKSEITVKFDATDNIIYFCAVYKNTSNIQPSVTIEGIPPKSIKPAKVMEEKTRWLYFFVFMPDRPGIYSAKCSARHLWDGTNHSVEAPFTVKVKDNTKVQFVNCPLQEDGMTPDYIKDGYNSTCTCSIKTYKNSHLKVDWVSPTGDVLASGKSNATVTFNSKAQNRHPYICYATNKFGYVAAAKYRPRFQSCKRRDSDIVIILDNSNRVTEEEFDNMKEEVDFLLARLDALSDNGQLEVYLRTFPSNTHLEMPKSGKSSRTPAYVRFMVGRLRYHGLQRPNMTLAVRNAKKELKRRARKGAEQIVVYVGRGQNVDRKHDAFIEYRVFSAFAVEVNEKGRFTSRGVEKTLRHNGRATPLGRDDVFLHIQNLLIKNCTECENPVIDMAILMENLRPESPFPIKDIVTGAIEKMRVDAWHTRIAVVSYGEDVYQSQTFGLEECGENKSDIVRTIRNFKNMNANSWNTSKAIQHALDNVFTPDKTRSGSKKMIVLFGNHLPDKSTMKMVDEAMRKDIYVYVAATDSFPSRNLTGLSFSTGVGRLGSLSKNQIDRIAMEVSQNSCLMSVIQADLKMNSNL